MEGGGVSGLHALSFRYEWERTGQDTLKQMLISYNADDCAALERVTGVVSRLLLEHPTLKADDSLHPDFARVESLPSHETMWPRFTSQIDGFEFINRAARWDYQRHRVYIRTHRDVQRATVALKNYRKRIGHINKEVWSDRAGVCPSCTRKTGKYSKQRIKILYDVRFTRFGVRRWVARYHIKDYYCPNCHRSFGTPGQFWQQGKYGRDLIAFVIFQVIELCMAQHTIGASLNRLFRLGLGQCLINSFKASAARYYQDTRQQIMKEVVKGNLVHVDETRIMLKGGAAYVWVFATFREVVYFYSESREGGLLQNLLRDFKGVLISDFYAVYDSIPCTQQKCLIHLIRDLNTAILEQPFDQELREIVTKFGQLSRRIVETIDHRGLKRRFLRKHIVEVERFYRNLRCTDYASEAALKCKQRFEKNRQQLFAFLNYDCVPWNNNNAEHAIKAFARLRRSIEGLSTPKGIDEYLVLLSICQTCKYMGVDFLDFLRSGEKDVHSFAKRNRTKIKAQGSLQHFADERTQNTLDH
jgi:hypothetical protein